MQALNPALVMILIPFNNLVLFPWLRKPGWQPTALRRMTIGIALTGASWIIVGVMQLALDGGTPFSIAWQIACARSSALAQRTGGAAISAAPPAARSPSARSSMSACAHARRTTPTAAAPRPR
jgi:hypothetical protein